MSGLVPLNASATLTVPYAPARFVRFDVEQPQNHCSLQQVKDQLFGQQLQALSDPDGSTKTLDRLLVTRFIPQVTGEVVQAMGTPYDWCRTIHFQDGTGSDSLTLPHRNIQVVLVCFLRVLPSLPWYRFNRFRNADGTEFMRIGGVEPPQTPTMKMPPDLIGGVAGGYPISSVDANVQPAQPIYTGIEDADMLVDTKRRMLRIPPRVLIAGVQFPIWNYTFMPATLNIETHYMFGFPPTKYENGDPLQYNTVTGEAIDPQPNSQAGDYLARIDWSSGMPPGLTDNVAQIVANRVLRKKWRIDSNGFSSVNVDGGSENYGNKPFGGDLDTEDMRIISTIVAKYGIGMAL